MNPIFFFMSGISNKRFVSVWNTNNAGSPNDTIQLPVSVIGIYNCIINWGDGTFTTMTSYSQGLHQYLTGPGTYTVTIIGIFTGFQFAGAGDCLKLIEVKSWGSLKIANASAFQGCANLLLNNVTDVLDISGTTSLNNMFAGCTALTSIGRSNEWNTSLVTTLQSVFNGCTNFNSDLNGWNTINVTQMTSTFAGCSNFNKPLNSWNTSNVTNFSSMFSSASIFNQDIGSWNVSKVTVFTSMFLAASAFNNGGAPMNWTLNTVGNIVVTSMFANATSFNQPIGSWDVSKITTIATMLSGATAFNQPLGAWRLISLAASSTTNFMLGKSALNFLQTNLDSIYNGWINVNLSTPQNINFSLAKQTKASIEGKALLTRASATVVITSATNSGGFVLITATNTLVNGNKVFISGVSTGVPDKSYTVSNVTGTNFTIDLAYTVNGTGGTLRTGFGWTITDGLLTITNVTQGGTNGAGGFFVRITTGAHGIPASSHPVMFIYGNTGTGLNLINGSWTINQINTTQIDLVGSLYGAGGFSINGNVVYD